MQKTVCEDRTVRVALSSYLQFAISSMWCTPYPLHNITILLDMICACACYLGSYDSDLTFKWRIYGNICKRPFGQTVMSRVGVRRRSRYASYILGFSLCCPISVGWPLLADKYYFWPSYIYAKHVVKLNVTIGIYLEGLSSI